MYSQLFGSYLLRKEAVTPDQLASAISEVKHAHMKLGTLAIHHGYMVASEVDEVCFLQTREDKRFGEIAVERGYLTDEQVHELLMAQTPDFLLLGQCLVDSGTLTNGDLERYIIDYETENGVCDIDLNVESKEKITKLIQRFFLVAEIPISDYSIMYMELMFNNLVRFIGDDFTPLTPVPCTEYPVSFCVSQAIRGNIQCISRIDMEREAAIEFASRYANEDFTEFNEYVEAALEDFVNLHNGLFIVNISNEYSIELTLEPPVVDKTEVITLARSSYLIPIKYPFGTIHLLVTLNAE